MAKEETKKEKSSNDIYQIAVDVVAEDAWFDIKDWRELSDFERDLLFFVVLGIATANRRCLDAR